MQAQFESEAPFRRAAAGALARTALLASLAAGAALTALVAGGGAGAKSPLPGAAALVALSLFYLLLAARWQAEWPVYGAQAALLTAYLHARALRPLPGELEALLLVALCFLDFGIVELLERQAERRWARPALHGALALPLLPLALALSRGPLDAAALLAAGGTAAYYALVGQQRGWRGPWYAAAVLANAFLWLLWARAGWRFENHPQYYLVPVGLSTVLFAEANRVELGRSATNALRGAGLVTIYLSTAVPLWRFESLGAWTLLLCLGLAGVLAGIALRAQSFVWLGLAAFVFDILYLLGLTSMEYPLARWAIMLGLGVLLVLFVALNEKRRIVAELGRFYREVREWE